MFCNKCGNQIQDDDRFCPYCGAKNMKAQGDVPTDPFGYPVSPYAQQQPYAQQPYAQQPPVQQQPQRDFSQQTSNSTNTYALVGFILSFFVPLLGLIFSIMGLQEANRNNGDRRGFAVAGIIISAVSMVISLIAVICIWVAVLSVPYYYI